MDIFERMLLDNEAWAEQKIENTPNFFKRLSAQQTPEVLWIGCSDSRVPSEIVVNAEPGEMFVHRNIANQFISTDFNSLSVLQYAVDVLKVSHVVVCGHYNCGGIRAAMESQSPELLMVNKWLKHIKDLYVANRMQFESGLGDEEAYHRLVELNVKQQVLNLAHTSIIQKAWAERSLPTLHGCVYGIDDGRIKEIIRLDAKHPIDPVYKYAFT
ncbi:MAG: hypothetical protein RLZ25_876 [Pseudomonadota bacterium]|jgi:carbonic anhydrase